MDTDVIIGCVLLVGSLGLLTILVFVSRRRIDRIARRGYRSARTIVKELNGGK